MNPGDWSARSELAYGGGITGLSVVMHYVNDYVTPIATALGALAGAIIGAHAVYRLIWPKQRRDRRVTDRE